MPPSVKISKIAYFATFPIYMGKDKMYNLHIIYPSLPHEGGEGARSACEGQMGVYK